MPKSEKKKGKAKVKGKGKKKGIVIKEKETVPEQSQPPPEPAKISEKLEKLKKKTGCCMAEQECDCLHTIDRSLSEGANRN